MPSTKLILMVQIAPAKIEKISAIGYSVWSNILRMMIRNMTKRVVATAKARLYPPINVARITSRVKTPNVR
ncbi:hypothetical protein Bmyc01_21880 [Bacillus mycoides]|nr:hypothetical protein Bmyc01_21880 [Bacillus mycoides]